MTKVEFYSDVHTPTIAYARQDDQWFIVNRVSDGWRSRCPWHPTPAVAARMARPENRTTFYGQAWLAEACYGIPRDLVAVVPLDRDGNPMFEAA